MGERGFFVGDLLIEAVLVAPDGGFKALQVGVPSASLLAQAFLADVDREEGCCSSAGRPKKANVFRTECPASTKGQRVPYGR